MDLFRRRVPDWIAKRKFTAHLGCEVSFKLIAGRWHANVTDCFRVHPRTEVLPVVCLEHGDVEAALEHLRGKSVFMGHYIHVMMGLDGEWGYVDLGDRRTKMRGRSSLSSNGPCGSLIGANVESSEDGEAMAGYELEEPTPIALEDIASIKDLVLCLNKCRAAEDDEKMKVLGACVRECKNEFNSKDIGYWTENSGHALHEYSILAGIKIHANRQLDHFVDEKKKLLKEIFTSLAEKIKIANYNHTSLIQAISFCMCKMDVSVFTENPGWVLQLALALVERLNSAPARYTPAHYAEHCSTFVALHRTLVVAGLADPDKWDVGTEETLFTLFREAFKKIDDSTEYYPFHFHILVLEQSLVRLTSGLHRHDCIQCVAPLLDGMFDMYQSLSFMAILYIYPTGVLGLECGAQRLVSGWKKIKQGFSHRGMRAHSWFDVITNVSRAYLKSLAKNEECPKLRGCLETFEAEEKTINTEEERTALRFGFVQQACKLVQNHPIDSTRKYGLQKLLSHARNWQEDVDVLKELLESLKRIAHQYGCEGEEKQATEKALENLPKFLDDNCFWSMDKLMKRSSDFKKNVKDALDAWSQGPESKVGSRPTGPDPSSKKWSRFIKNCLGGKDAQEAAVHTLELKQHYGDETFACIPSFLPDREKKHVRSTYFHLMLVNRLTEERQSNSTSDTCPTEHKEIKTPIDLGDIFREDLPHPGERANAIRKVIVVGQPGVGKTTLSRMLAYKWSEGRWCQDLFDNVYVLPVRDLVKSRYDNLGPRRHDNLATAIANICFHGHRSDKCYDTLRNRINMNLRSPKTLVILDGFDERHGFQMKILEEANKITDREHKLLLLSCPHGIVGETADREVVHAGFDTHQVESYVKSEVRQESDCNKVLKFIRRQPSMKALAHVPMNLALLCNLWEDAFDRDVVYSQARNSSAPGLYRKLADSYWDHIRRKQTDQNLEDIGQEALFNKFGKIALCGVNEGLETFTKGFISNALREGEHRVNTLLNLSGCFLVSCSEDCIRFPHKTFQDYFAGRLLARLLLSGSANSRMEANHILHEHKYKLHSRRMLLSMASEMSGEYGQGSASQMLSTIQEEPQEVVGLQHVLVQLQVLCECLSSAERTTEAYLHLEDRLDVAQSVLAWFRKGLHLRQQGCSGHTVLMLVTEALANSHMFLYYQPELQEELIKISGSENSTIRRLVINALGTIFGASHCEAPIGVLDCLIEASRDEDERVRCTAILSLGLVYKISHPRSEIIADRLIHCLEDDRSEVFHAAIRTLVSILKHFCSEEAESVLCRVFNSIGKKNSGSYFMPIDLFQEILDASPSSEDLLLMHLRSNIHSMDHAVRAAAVAAMAGIFSKISISERDHLLDTLISACGHDDHHSVRSEATKALGELFIATNDLHASEALMDATNDKDIQVELCALRALLSIESRDSIAQTTRDGLWNRLIEIASSSQVDYVAKALPVLGLLFEPSSQWANTIFGILKRAGRDANESIAQPANDALMGLYKPFSYLRICIVRHFFSLCKSNFGVKVHFDALQRLATLSIGSQANARRVWKSLLEMSTSKDPVTRASALEALVKAAQANPSGYPDCIECLKNALQDRNVRVRSRASRLLEEMPPQHLIEVYWVINEEQLIPAITFALCQAALVVRKQSQDRNVVVLYWTSGQVFEWTKPFHEVQKFQEEISKFVSSLREE